MNGSASSERSFDVARGRIKTSSWPPLAELLIAHDGERPRARVLKSLALGRLLLDPPARLMIAACATAGIQMESKVSARVIGRSEALLVVLSTRGGHPYGGGAP
jgi:hypothetical protein